MVYLVTAHRRLQRADWSDLPRQLAVFEELCAEPGFEAALEDRVALMYASQFLPLAPARRARLARETGRRVARGAAERIWLGGGPRGDGRLRIGYLSADFRVHPCAQLLLPVLRAHDRRRFQVTLFPLNADDGSDLRRQLFEAAERVVDLSRLNDHDAAWRIRESGCDVLLFVNGYTEGGRPAILAQHAAPVQLSWLGYHGTLGGGLVDYHVADALSTPPEDGDLWSEARLFLPHGAIPFQHHGHAPAAPDRATAGLPAEVPVLAALHRPEKIDPGLFACWMRLLAAEPATLLWLMDAGEAARTALRSHAAAAGIDPARLLFAPRCSPERHQARLAAADLWLDTRWYGAHTTLLDALGAALPAVAIPGDDVQGRQGISLLHAAGTPELVAASLLDYERLVLDLLRDPSRRAALRARLRARTAPLFDVVAFTRTLEEGCRRVLERQRAGLPPVDAALPADAYTAATAVSG